MESKMSSSDPFFLVRQEIQDSVSSLIATFGRFEELDAAKPPAGKLLAGHKTTNNNNHGSNNNDVLNINMNVKGDVNHHRCW